MLNDLQVYVYTPSLNYIGVRGKTDAAGSAAFTLADGKYRFRVESLGSTFWTPDHTVPAEKSTVLTISHGRADVHVTRWGTDVVGATVHLFDSAGIRLDQSMLTNSSGSAQFSLPAGRYKFRVDYDGKQYWSDVISVTGNESNQIKIEVGP